MTGQSSEERRLSSAELALVRHGLQHPGRSVADESTLRYAFSLARLSLQATPHVVRALAEFRRAALGTAHALFGDAIDSPRTPDAELLRAAAARLWRITLGARDDTGDRQLWDTAARKRQLLLALGGGGGVGHVYLGCFQILEEWGLRPELIAGSSCGAVLGLFRAQRPSYQSDDIRMVLESLTHKKLFRVFQMRSQYALPGPLRLYLRSALLPVLRRLRREGDHEEHLSRVSQDDRSITFADLAIPLVVVVAGVRKGMLPRPPKEYERLLDPRSFFPPTPRKLQRRVQDLLSVLGEFIRQPNRLDAVYLGADSRTRGFDVVDAVGFSCSLPGFIHYDVLREDPLAHRRIQRLLEERELGWLSDGGLVENCPALAARTAYDALPVRGPRNGFVLALDAFSPKLTHALWIPIQRLAQETVRRVLSEANLYVPFPRALSPLSILPTKEQIARAVMIGRAELAPHMPFLAKVLTPLPALEASRPAAA